MPRADVGKVTGLLLPKGQVDTDGTMCNPIGWPVGKVKADGTIRNNFGVKVGSVQGQDPARLEQVEKGGAALLFMMQE